MEGAALALVEGDKGAPSWLAKLGVTKHLLVDECEALLCRALYVQHSRHCCMGRGSCRRGGCRD